MTDRSLTACERRATDAYASAMRGTLPRNGSLVIQAATAIVVVVLALRGL